jgi:hypothetical protein
VEKLARDERRVDSETQKYKCAVMGAVGSVDNRLRLSKERGQPPVVTRAPRWLSTLRHSPQLSCGLAIENSVYNDEQAIANSEVMIIVLNQEWRGPDSKSLPSRRHGAANAKVQGASRRRSALVSLIAHGPNTTRDIRCT